MNTRATAHVDSTYAWLRLLATLVLTAVGCAGMYIAMVAVPAYQQAFDLGRGAASAPYTLLMLGFGVGGIVVGWLVDQFGIVRPLAGCVVALAVTFLLASATDSFLVFSLLHGLLGAFGCAAVFSPLLADISMWFVTLRGFAIAAAASGNYLAGAIWPAATELMLQNAGLRGTYAIFGVVSAVVMLPLLLALRRVPVEQVVTVPDGGTRGSPRSLGLSSRGFIALLCLAGIGCCTAMAMPQVHVVALAFDLGIPTASGAQMLSVMFGCGVISRLSFGWLSDHIGGLATLLCSSTLQAVSILFFLPADTEQALFVVCALFGLFQGGIVPCYALIVREYLPAEEAASRTGVVILATLVGMAFGGWASGAIHDVVGEYDLAFIHGFFWNLVNIAIISFLLFRQWRVSPWSQLHSAEVP